MIGGFIYEGTGQWQSVVVSHQTWNKSDNQWFQVALSAFACIVLFFFLEETSFVRRPEFHEIDLRENDVGLDRLPHPESPEEESVDQPKDDNGKNASPAVQIMETDTYTPTPWPGLPIRQFIKRSDHPWGIMWRGLVQPFALLQIPIVLWCGLMFGVYQVYFNCKFMSVDSS
jgi:hypothetical protein